MLVPIAKLESKISHDETLRTIRIIVKVLIHDS